MAQGKGRGKGRGKGSSGYGWGLSKFKGLNLRLVLKNTSASKDFSKGPFPSEIQIFEKKN